MNPFTTEFSLPSSQPITPHAPGDEYGQAGQGLGAGLCRSESKKVDILFVHHDDEEEEGQEEVGYDEEQQHYEGSYPTKSNLPFLQTTASKQTTTPMTRNPSNQWNYLEVEPPLTAVPFSATPKSGGFQRSFSEECRQEEEFEEEQKRNWKDPSPLYRDKHSKESWGDEQEEREVATPTMQQIPSSVKGRIVYNPPESPPRRGLREHQGLSHPSLSCPFPSYLILVFSWHQCFSSSRSLPLFASKTNDATAS
jgi:hypothetical protein